MIRRPVRIVGGVPGARLTSSGGNERTVLVDAAAAGTEFVDVVIERTDDGGVLVANGDVRLSRCVLRGGDRDFGLQAPGNVRVVVDRSVVEGAKVALDVDGRLEVANTFFRGGPGGGGSRVLKLASGTTGFFLHNTAVVDVEDGFACGGSTLRIDRSMVVGASRNAAAACPNLGQLLIGDVPEDLGLDDLGRPGAQSPALGAAVRPADDPALLDVDYDGAPRPRLGADVGADEVP